MYTNICFVLLLCGLTHQLETDDFDFVHIDGIRSLSELPLERLLQLKHSFTPKYEFMNESLNLENIESRTFDEHDFGHPEQSHAVERYEEWDGDKNSKISKIFYATISALSFLAFGGYLITLVVTAINQHKNANNGTATPTVIFLSKYKRPKRNFVHDPEYCCDSERLYRGMIILSEDFAKLN